MSRIARILLTAAAAMAVTGALAACATVEGYRQQTALWLGYPADSLLLERGAPVQRDRLSDGREVWVYFEQQHHHTDGYTTSEPRTRTVTRRNSDGTTSQITESYYVERYTPPTDTWTECETRFVIGLNGLVEDFRFTGNGCVAEEIY